MYLRTNEYAKGAGRNPKADLSGINGKQGAASGEKQLQRGKLSLWDFKKVAETTSFPVDLVSLTFGKLIALVTKWPVRGKTRK